MPSYESLLGAWHENQAQAYLANATPKKEDASRGTKRGAEAFGAASFSVPKRGQNAEASYAQAYVNHLQDQARTLQGGPQRR